MSATYESALQKALDSLDRLSTGESETEQESEWEIHGMHEAKLGHARRPRLTPHLLAAMNRHREKYQRLMRAVASMHKHIGLRNGRLHFTLPARSNAEAAAKLGISPSMLAHLHASVRAGHLHAHRFSVFARPMSTARIVSAELEFESGASCAGVTKVDTNWWGVQLYIDECKTANLVATLNGGSAGANVVCAVLAFATEGVAKAVCGLLAALGRAESWLIDTVDSSGGRQGVILTWTWVQVASAAIPVSAVAAIPIVTSQGS